MTPSSKNILDAATYCKVMGRHVRNEDGSIAFDWPALSLEFRQVTGTSSIAVRIPKLSGSVLGYGIKVIDGSPSEPPEEQLITQQIFSREYKLAVDLNPSKSYDVSIWKRDDPALVKVEGLLVDEGGTAKVVDTDQSNNKNERRLFIEFVGDSDTVGFGNEGPYSGLIRYILFESWFDQQTRRATNVRRSWARHVADTFDADYSIIAWSGFGAKYSVVGSSNIFDVYPRLLATDKKSKSKDLGPADAVVMYIGQNDQSALEESWGSLERKMSSGFEELVLLIRQHRSCVPIILVTPSPDCMVSCVMTEKQRNRVCNTQTRLWKAVMEKLGGTEKGYHLVENRHEPQIEFNSREDFGMCLHWNAESNEKFANGLIPKIRELVKKKP